MLTGDAANADPVCDLSQHHSIVTDAVAKAQVQVPTQPVAAHPIVFRDDRNSRKLSEKVQPEASQVQ